MSYPRPLYLTAGITIQFQRNITITRQISRRWYNIVESTPRLWSVITGFDPLEVTAKALLESGDSALIIRGEFGPNDMLGAQAFIDIVCHHFHRWEGANLTLPSNIEVAWLQTPAPRLRAFKLRLQRELVWPIVDGAPPTAAPNHGLVNLFGGNAPLLQNIEIATPGHTLIRLRSFIFDHLKEISLTDIQLSTDQFLMALQRNPNIEIIRLTRPGFGSHSCGLVDTIELPHLSLLELVTVASGIIQEIVCHIRAPFCTGVTIHPDTKEVNGHPLAASWLRLHLPRCFPALLESPLTEIMAMYMQGRMNVLASEDWKKRFARWNNTDSTKHSGLSLLSHLPGTLSENQAELQILPWLSSVYKLADITLNLAAFRGDALAGVDEALLASIPNTTTLALAGQFDNSNLFNILSAPYTTGERPVWLLPRLETLTVSVVSPITRKDVLNLVKARYGGGSSLEPPIPLKRLDISRLAGGDDQEVYEALCDLVGVNVLTWDRRPDLQNSGPADHPTLS